jgi:ATP-dependent RNA helicase RhlB
MRTLLFVNTKRFAERLVGTLERHGWRIGALTGDIPQPRRLKILSDFRGGSLPLLVATDVASRGLHIEGVTHVINVDLPQDPEDYVHRIGRTARAGRAGKAISLADEDYVFSLDAIQRLIGMKIPVEFADDKLFAGDVPAKPKIEKIAAPPAPKAQEKTAPSAPPRISSKVEEAAALPDRPRSTVAPEQRRAPPIEAPATAPPTFEEIPSSVPSFEEIPSSSLSLSPSPPSSLEEISSLSLIAADFWTREAFGLDAPEGGFGTEPPEAPLPGSPGGTPAKRRRRRRGRRVAPRAEAAAPA